MKHRASVDQVHQSGLSFLFIALAFASLIGMAIYLAIHSPDKDFTFIWGLIGITLVIIAEFGLSMKLITDGITLGLENAKMNPRKNRVKLMTFEETFSAGFDLILVLGFMIILSAFFFYLSINAKNDFNQTLFLVIAVATILSGILGLHVKIVADSIAHGMVASGFSELSKYIGEEGIINSKNIDRNSDEVPRISPKEWQDSNGVMWKKHEGLLYYWNGEQWDVHQQLTVVEEPNWDNYFERFCSKAITKFESSSDEITIQKLHSIINMYNYENTDRTNSITDFFSKSVFSINKILLLAPNEFYAKFQEHKYYPKYEKIFSDPMKLTIKQKQAFFVLANQLLEMIEW